MPVALALTFLVFGVFHACLFWMGAEWVPLLGALCFSAAGGVMLFGTWWDVWREGVFAEVVFVLLMGLAALAISQTRFSPILAPAGYATPVIVMVALGFGGLMALLLVPHAVRAWRRLASG